MKLLIFSDLHAHQFSEFAYINNNGINSRLHFCLDIIDQIKIYAIENDIKYVLFAGDLFHTRPAVDTLTHNLTLKKIIELSNELDRLIILPGNHDSYTKNTSYNSLKILESTEDISLLNTWTCDSIPMGISNYYEDNYIEIIPLECGGPIEEAHKRISKNMALNILVSHNEIIGSQTPSGYVFEEGLDSKTLSDNFDFVFNGHIHKYQQFHHNVFNIGSPLHQDWGDKNNKKGFLVLDTDTKKVDFIQSKYPEFREIEESEIAKYEGDTYNYYKINFDKMLKENDIKKIKEKFKFCVINYKIQTENKKRTDIDLDMSWDKIIKEYVKNSTTELDKKVLLEKGMGVMK